jgi:hypothetical protein
MIKKREETQRERRKRRGDQRGSIPLFLLSGVTGRGGRHVLESRDNMCLGLVKEIP